MTWGNQYAKASVVSAYTVLQPVTSGTISALFVAVKGSAWADTYGFTPPGWQDLGIIGIVLGLAVLFSERTLQVEEVDESANEVGMPFSPSPDLAKQSVP